MERARRSLLYKIHGIRFIETSKIVKLITAERLASTTKRLDKCSADIARLFNSSGLSNKLPIRDKICLEIGSGWVLSHSCVLFLLGAKKVIATDIERNACPKTLRKSIQKSNMSNICEILAPFEEKRMIRARLKRLFEIKAFSFHELEELHIKYLAPIDLAVNPLGTKVDFILSLSVLEHVPVSDVLPLLRNLAHSLSSGGTMIHAVHLEDHKDCRNAPFDFLGEPENKFTRKMQNIRGNRLRRSNWRSILSEVDSMQFRFVREGQRKDKNLPKFIDPSIHYIDEKDLRTSHLLILGTKK